MSYRVEIIDSKEWTTIEKKKRWQLVLNIVLIAAFLVLLVLVSIRVGPYITRMASKPDQFRVMLKSYGWKSVPVFILLQMLQVVIAAIPGEFIQIAGGYIYGSLPGTLYSLIGILAGSMVVFCVSRLLGYSLVRMFVSEKKLEKFDFMMNSKQSDIITFVLFLIPGMPKDVLTYIAGLIPVKPLRFFLIMMVGRFPALFGSAFIGSNLQKENYITVVMVSTVALVLFVSGLLLRDKVVNGVQRLLRRSDG